MAVLDASAAISLVCDGVPENLDESLSRLVSDEEFIAPSLFCVEVAQVAWKYQQAGMAEAQDAQKLMRIAISYVDELVDDAELLAEAYQEAVCLKHSVYDMLYFVLARRRATTLVTCDQKLARLCEENNVEHATIIALP